MTDEQILNNPQVATLPKPQIVRVQYNLILPKETIWTVAKIDAINKTEQARAREEKYMRAEEHGVFHVPVFEPSQWEYKLTGNQDIPDLAKCGLTVFLQSVRDDGRRFQVSGVIIETKTLDRTITLSINSGWVEL